jgi:hypothetical protein
MSDPPNRPSSPPRFIIRRELGGIVMWLTREQPQGWGDRERAHLSLLPRKLLSLPLRQPHARRSLERAHFRLNTAAKDIAVGMKHAAEADQRARRSEGRADRRTAIEAKIFELQGRLAKLGARAEPPPAG